MSPVSWGDIFTLLSRGDRIMELRHTRTAALTNSRAYVPRGLEAEQLKQGNTWHVVDAAGQVLGRLATRVARVLIGKDKPTFTPFLDSGDHVVVINADK